MSDVKYVKKSFKKWMQENYEPNELEDIAKYGAQGGFHGLIYYSETCALYEKYCDDIWAMINEDADNMGMTPLAFIASFNGASNVVDDQTIKNLLVWFCAEKVAYELTEHL